MKNMFVVTSVYTKSLDEVEEKRGEHLAFISNYVLAGKFLFVGRQNPATGAVIIAHNSTKEELIEIFKNDPYCTNNLAEYTVIEFTPAMYSQGLEDVLKSLK